MEAQEKQVFYKVCLKNPLTLRGTRNLDGSYNYELPEIVKITEEVRGKKEIISYAACPVIAVMTEYGLKEFFTGLSISGPEDCQKGLCYDHYSQMDDMEAELAFTSLSGKDKEENAENMERYESALRSKAIRPVSKGSMVKSVHKRPGATK